MTYNEKNKIRASLATQKYNKKMRKNKIKTMRDVTKTLPYTIYIYKKEKQQKKNIL